MTVMKMRRGSGPVVTYANAERGFEIYSAKLECSVSATMTITWNGAEVYTGPGPFGPSRYGEGSTVMLSVSGIDDTVPVIGRIVVY
jgi:hypothetical protein